ncbi:hypothetical protein PG994_014699 [Apiospora phragmitis]|uniref:Uncharacterized protein n=1 Tax=Apiospora phragmitis TaxID=2905665 RepID=A0ABR1SUC1_9PEZI
MVAVFTANLLPLPYTDRQRPVQPYSILFKVGSSTFIAFCPASFFGKSEVCQAASFDLAAGAKLIDCWVSSYLADSRDTTQRRYHRVAGRRESLSVEGDLAGLVGQYVEKPVVRSHESLVGLFNVIPARSAVVGRIAQLACKLGGFLDGVTDGLYADLMAGGGEMVSLEQRTSYKQIGAYWGILGHTYIQRTFVCPEGSAIIHVHLACFSLEVCGCVFEGIKCRDQLICRYGSLSRG